VLAMLGINSGIKVRGTRAAEGIVRNTSQIPNLPREGGSSWGTRDVAMHKSGQYRVMGRCRIMEFYVPRWSYLRPASVGSVSDMADLDSRSHQSASGAFLYHCCCCRELGHSSPLVMRERSPAIPAQERSSGRWIPASPPPGLSSLRCPLPTPHTKHKTCCRGKWPVDQRSS
jgi:hypothetical protein